MPRQPQAKPQRFSHPPAPPPIAESRAVLIEAIEHLKRLAERTRSKLPELDFEAYMQSGHGPSYQRDAAVCSEHSSIIRAFEYAAYQLEQTQRALEQPAQPSSSSAPRLW